jgi:hypothetical protein
LSAIRFYLKERFINLQKKFFLNNEFEAEPHNSSKNMIKIYFCQKLPKIYSKKPFRPGFELKASRTIYRLPTPINANKTEFNQSPMTKTAN